MYTSDNGKNECMFKIYIRDKSQNVLESYKTDYRDLAARHFEDLISRSELDGQPLAVVLTFNSKQVACHRFDKQQGHQNYWRGRTHEIKWPESIPPRRVGRPTLYGAIRKNITISDELWAQARQIGGGNASRGIQKAIKSYDNKK